MKRTIIALCGHIGAGKSSVAREIYNRLDNAMIIPMAGVAKQCVEIITGVDMDERQPDGSYDYSRKSKAKLLPSGSTLGIFMRDFAEAVRSLDEMVWINATFNIIESSSRRYYIIPDIRMYHEFQYLRSLEERSDDYSAYVFRINPDEKLLSSVQYKDGRDGTHVTEADTSRFCVDGSYLNSYGFNNVGLIADSIVKTIHTYE